MPVARKVAASGSNPGYRLALRELYGGAEDFLMRDRRLTQSARVEDTPECRVGFPILYPLSFILYSRMSRWISYPLKNSFFSSGAGTQAAGVAGYPSQEARHVPQTHLLLEELDERLASALDTVVVKPTT